MMTGSGDAPILYPASVIRFAALLSTIFLGACARHAHVAPSPSQPPASTPPPIVQPGAPGQPGREITPEKSRDLSAVEYTGADIKFMQGMIGHHAQALEMVELLKKNSQSGDMKKLGQRIELSQDDEIKMMQGWLELRGQRVPGRTEHHQHGATLMPGMLTPDEMLQLEQAKGPAFDRLFLEGMIKHHGGALQMVRELLDTPGAAQESDVFGFIADVEADQRAEIDRMSALLAALK